MKRLLILLMLLCISNTHAESLPVLLLPQDHTCLASVSVGAGEEYRLMALADQVGNAVKLAIAARSKDGVYHVEALSNMIIALQEWDPDAVWMQDKWQDGHPYFWWGAGKEQKTEEFYLQFEHTADLGWMIASGYMTDNITGVTYHFNSGNPGFMQVSGKTFSPAIVWPTELPMALEGFCLHALDDVCDSALRYLALFSLEHPFGAQDEGYHIVW